MQHLGLVIQGDWYSIALINGSKLDPVTKLKIESVAKNASGDKTLTVKSSEEAILRMKGAEEGTVGEELKCDEVGDQLGKTSLSQKKWGQLSSRGRGGMNNRGRGTCHNCGRYDHFHRQCPNGNMTKRKRTGDNLVR